VAEVQQAAERVADVKNQIEGMRQTATRNSNSTCAMRCRLRRKNSTGGLSQPSPSLRNEFSPWSKPPKRQSVAWLNTKLEQDLAPYLARAAEAVTRIEASQQRAEERCVATRISSGRRRKRSIRETTVRMQQGTEKYRRTGRKQRAR